MLAHAHELNQSFPKPIQWRYSDPTRRIRSKLSLPHATSSSQIVIVMRYVSGS
jgi:hypothetical protein